MTNPSLRPLRPEQFDYWAANHLLNRAGFGGTPAQVRALANLGLDRAVEYIVEYESLPDEQVTADLFDHDIMRPLTPAEREVYRRARANQDEDTIDQFRRERQRRQRQDRQQIAEMQRWWLKRFIETGRPLEEKMTLFWHGHFATGYRKIEDSYHMFVQNQFFRANATGRFTDLVAGIIRDAAMLAYLDNQNSRRQAPNENLARELLELFTMGEGSGYTERDIAEAARALTGYSYEDDTFRFRPALHDGGRKTILGQTGNWNADDLVRIIFTQRVVSEFICSKLYRFFVNDHAGAMDRDWRTFIEHLARELRREQYRIKPVLTALFKSEHFYDSAHRAAVIKSPIQLIVQSIRALRTPIRPLDALLSAADLMGQNLFQPPSVKGWDGGRTWINTSTLFVRQNLLVYLLTGRRPTAMPWEAEGTAYDAMHLIDHLTDESATPDPEVAMVYLLRFAFGAEPHPSRVAALTRFVADNGGQLDNDMLIGVLSLITAMPEYQLC